jgi:hypothetical protein
MLWITVLGLEKNRGEKWRRGGDPHLRPCRRPKLRRQTSPQVLPHLPPPPPLFPTPLPTPLLFLPASTAPPASVPDPEDDHGRVELLPRLGPQGA